jgi:hypothetical protein
MSQRRSAIVAAIKTYLVSHVSGLAAGQVRRQPVDLRDVHVSPTVFLVEIADLPDLVGSGRVDRHLQLVVVIVQKPNPGSTTDEPTAAEDFAEDVQVALESFAESGLGSVAVRMQEDQGGTEFMGMGDKDRFNVTATTWVITYQRTRGTA